MRRAGAFHLLGCPAVGQRSATLRDMRQRAPPLPFTLQPMTDAAAHAAANAEQLRVLREALGEASAPVLTTAPPPLECGASLPTGEVESSCPNVDQNKNLQAATEKQGALEKKGHR